MSDLLLQPYTQTQYDAVSEASTDGDDQLMSVPCGMASKRKNIANNKIKSSLCKNFSEKGHCPYGQKCQFAHGIDELRCNVDENSYKTKPCNAFWKKGCCTYGHRCNFSHLVAPSDLVFPENNKVRGGFREIRMALNCKDESRLMSLLQ